MFNIGLLYDKSINSLYTCCSYNKENTYSFKSKVDKARNDGCSWSI